MRAVCDTLPRENVATTPHGASAGGFRHFALVERRHAPAQDLCGGVATFLREETSRTARLPALRGLCDIRQGGAVLSEMPFLLAMSAGVPEAGSDCR